MQQNHLIMEEVLQGKRILDDVMNKKVPHLSRLNLFPFSFSFLRQLDKEALNQYLEQLQNMWEAYLRTKGTIQQPLFLQHLDFLQQIQIWYIKNNVLSNNAVHTRWRPVRPQTTKREEPMRTPFDAKEQISDEEDDEEDEDSESDEEDDGRYEKGKEKTRERERDRKERRRERERDIEDRRDVEKKKSGDSDWREDWEISSKRKKGNKKHRHRDEGSRKHKKKRYEEKDEKRKEKHKREKEKAKKKKRSQSSEEEEDERAYLYKRKRSLDSDEKMMTSDDEFDEDDAEIDESAGFSIYSHRGSKKRRNEKTNEEDILESIMDAASPPIEGNVTRKSGELKKGNAESGKEPPPLRRPISIPLSTLTSNLIHGNTAAPATSRGSFTEFQNSGNLLNMHAPAQEYASTQRVGEAAYASTQRMDPDAQGDAQATQSNFSYRDASQILLNARPPYKSPTPGNGNRFVPDADAHGPTQQNAPELTNSRSEIESTQDPNPAQPDLKTSSPNQEPAKDGNLAQSGEFAHYQNEMADQIAHESENREQQLQQMYNQHLLAPPRHYEQFTQDPHQIRQFQKQHMAAQRGPMPQGEMPVAGLSAKSEKRLSRYRSSPSKALLERMEAAISARMHVLRRFPGDPEMELARKFTILGTTGSVYTITISNLPSCNCPDSAKGHHCCHILFVLLKILKVSQHEAVLYQRALLNAELREIYKDAPPNPASTITLPPYGVAPVQAQIAGDCPVCCEAFVPSYESEPVVWCKGGCGSNIHKSCFEIYAGHAQQPQFPDKVFCPVCEMEWISDGKPLKKLPEKEVKPKRGKKDKPKQGNP
eukprot:Phypoly_transcript_02757.p1 GENE.Phypoly_transcript_02757~~Phypoly_transcript_02757.p1  ORF type:complete len:821 (+),score=224.52 Phypoly_transcript_02757:184-2646(+)